MEATSDVISVCLPSHWLIMHARVELIETLIVQLGIRHFNCYNWHLISTPRARITDEDIDLPAHTCVCRPLRAFQSEVYLALAGQLYIRRGSARSIVYRYVSNKGSR